MKEFIPCICWVEFWTKISVQVNALINAGFKGLRIFFNLCDLPYTENINQLYINHLFATMPNPMHAWTFEGHASVNTTSETMKDHIDFCKKYNWLPIICMGYQEETPHNWLGRVPKSQYWGWLGKFAYEFALYLKYTMGFSRADLEIWNEPSKLQGLGFGWDKYCDLALIMANGWKQINNYKVHVFADDLLRTEYLNNILTREDLMKRVDYISTHIGVGSEDEEWDRGLVQSTALKISRYPHLRQALTEMSVNGIWSRLNQLPNNVVMYGIIGAIRNKEFGTATRIDDIWMWGSGDELQITSSKKAQILKDFNKKYYTPYEIEDMGDDFMKLEKFYYKEKVTFNRDINKAGIKFIQSCLNLKTDGVFGLKTESAVKAYQISLGLADDGIVGPVTYKLLITNYPDKYDELIYNIAVGDW
jgi:peptidoglycan hydrolase-like protein with peptidoglycan-binding domain